MMVWKENDGTMHGAPFGIMTFGVHVRLRDGVYAYIEPRRAGELRWSHTGGDDDIVSYHVPAVHPHEQPADGATRSVLDPKMWGHIQAANRILTTAEEIAQWSWPDAIRMVEHAHELLNDWKVQNGTLIDEVKSSTVAGREG